MKRPAAETRLRNRTRDPMVRAALDAAHAARVLAADLAAAAFAAASAKSPQCYTFEPRRSRR